MNNHRDILLKILETIGYQDDKEAFVSEFEKNIQLQTIADLIKSLPFDRQDIIKQKLGDASNNPEKVSAVLKDRFPESQLQMALENTAQDSITKYIQSIQKTLSESQRNDLIKVLQEIGHGSTQVTA